MLSDQKSLVHAVQGPTRGDKQTDTQTNIATYRLNLPRGRFSENKSKNRSRSTIRFTGKEIKNRTHIRKCHQEPKSGAK